MKKGLILQYKTLFKSVRQYKKQSILTPTLVILEVIFEVLIPLIMAEMINRMTGDTMKPIYYFGSILIVMAILALISGMLAGKYAATASTGFAKNLRKDMYYKIQDFSFNEIDRFSSSSLVTRLTTDVTNAQNSYQTIIRIAIRTPLMMIFAFIMACTISWKMALVFVLIVPILGVGLGLILIKVFPIFKRIFNKYDQLNNKVQENVSGIRVVKSFVREDYESDNFEMASKSVRDDFTRAEKIISLNHPLMVFCTYAVSVLVAFFGSKMIIETQSVGLTTGELSSLVTYSVMILMSVIMFSTVFVMIAISAESVNRIVEVLDTESSLSPNLDGEKQVEDGSIEFKNVCFSYSQDSSKYVLQDIDVKIKSGETIGVLGVTGSGKTSFVQLIPRLYDVSAGEVIVGGKNVKDYNLHDLRESVAFVLQKNVLFSGTIEENIKWGRKDASLDEIKEASRLACADEFVEQLSKKYQTYVERGGSNVSGGQKQRICIARALIKNPKIIVFDDSTSAIDTKTNAKITENMAKALPNTTKIIIAQRVASIQTADRIIIIENGKIVDFGTHENLLMRNDSYKEIYYSQMKTTGGVENA
ncbi:MAG: ABC transporter ATP-binding protein [Candidatus Izemoplasmatales bacterium]